MAQPIQLLYESFEGGVIEGVVAMTEIAVGTDGQLYFTAGKSGDADYRVFRADRCVEMTFLANGTKVSGSAACMDALSTMAQSALAANLKTGSQSFGAEIGVVIGGLLTALIVYLVLFQN